MRKVDQAVHEFAAEHHQLVTRDEFLRFGSVDQLKRRLRSGALIRVYDSIYRLPGTQPTWRQDLLAACWAGGKPSAASFRAAAQMTYLPGGEELVEITCPRHRRAQYEGVIAHESRFLSEDDLLVIDGIPVTRAARTLCDLAGLVELGTLEQSVLDHALLEAVRRDLVDTARVWREHERLGGTKRLGGDVIYRALQRFVPPVRKTETSPESLVLQMLRAHGLPEPVPQFWLQLGNGEWIRLDFAWPRQKAALEWDPYKYHGDRDRYEKMQARTRLMRAIGWERVCLTDDDFNAGMPESLAAVDEIFASHLRRL
jgi:hypothetical protein